MPSCGSALAGCLLALVSGAAGAEPPTRVFDHAAFVGLKALPLSAGDPAALEVDTFDQRNGTTLTIETCADVTAADPEQIQGPQYALFQLLTVNCQAVAKFTASTPAKKTHFPRQITANEVLRFPADAVPVLAPSEQRKPLHRTSLRTALREPKAVANREGSVTLATDEDRLDYRVLARADLNGDGWEDLLVRVDWSTQGGRGRAFDLLVVSKRSRTAPMTVSWRR